MTTAKCTKCHSIIKIDENKYAVDCPRCAQEIIVEDAIDLMASGADIDVNHKLADVSDEQLLEYADAYLESDDYGEAKDLFTLATARDAENPKAWWGLCLSVLCAQDPKLSEGQKLYLQNRKEDAVSFVSESQGITAAMATHNLITSLKAISCFTDEESDDLFEKALEVTPEDEKEELALKYSAFAFRESEDTEESTNRFRLPNMIANIRPNFGEEQKISHLKFTLLGIISFALFVGTIVLMSFGFTQFYVIIACVVTAVLGLFFLLAVLLDKKKVAVYQIIKAEKPISVVAIAKRLYPVSDADTLRSAVSMLLNMIGSMVLAQQLTFIGTRAAELFEYYDSNGNLLEIEPSAADLVELEDVLEEVPDTSDPAVTAQDEGVAPLDEQSPGEQTEQAKDLAEDLNDLDHSDV